MNITKQLQKKKYTSILFQYACPAIISMWIFSLYTIVDGIFIGKGVGEKALGAVSLSMPFINGTFALSIMTSIGASTIIGNLLGRKKVYEAREYFSLTVKFLALSGFFICLLGKIFIGDIAVLLGAPSDMVPLIKEYLGTILFFNTFYLIAYALEILIKVEGRPDLAMKVVLLAALTNIALDYLLVIVFPLGLRGAAIATGTAQLIQCLILLWFFIKKSTTLKFVKTSLSMRDALNLIKIGIPDSITEFSIGFMILIFNRVSISTYGENGLVAFTIISYINNFMLMTMIGLTQGMQPIVSYLEGAGLVHKRRLFFKLTKRVSILIGGLFFIGILVFSREITGLFISGDELITFTSNALRLFSTGFILVGINIVTSGYFTALEKTFKAALISLSRGIILIPLLISIIPRFSSDGIWYIIFISEFLTLLLGIFLIKKKTEIIST